MQLPEGDKSEGRLGLARSLTNGGTSAHIATIKHIIHCHGRPACSQLYDELETHIEQPD